MNNSSLPKASAQRSGAAETIGADIVQVPRFSVQHIVNKGVALNRDQLASTPPPPRKELPAASCRLPEEAAMRNGFNLRVLCG